MFGKDWIEVKCSKSDDIRIYECHVGMSDEEPGIASFNFFEYHILPRIVSAGYNCVLIGTSYSM